MAPSTRKLKPADLEPQQIPAAAPKQAEAENRGPVERDWIAEARQMLIGGGVAAVQINPLAARLKVTRGGFYWRFRNRKDLLNHLLEDWRSGNCRSFMMALERVGSPQERYRRVVRMLVEEKDFDPALDTAIRQWGTVDAEVRKIVNQVDNERIGGFVKIFLEAGQDSTEAMVRARVVYFHQVGYYALGIDESRAERRRLVSTYDRILTGFALD
jgi:AcrR family transcriptional regulator